MHRPSAGSGMTVLRLNPEPPRRRPVERAGRVSVQSKRFRCSSQDFTTGLPKPMRSHKIGDVEGPILAEVATGSVIIGISLIVLIGAIMIAAVIRFDVDAVLKIWGALGTLLGLVVGTMGTYFFTKDQIQQKDLEIRLT
jgi:hypothetical protein